MSLVVMVMCLARMANATDYVVDSLTDTLIADGHLTLREALAAANTDSAVYDAPAGNGADTISFASTLFGAGAAQLNMAGTEYLVTDSVTINGPGADLLTINAQQFSRHFRVDDSTSSAISVQINHVRLQNGLVDVSGNGPASSGGSISNTESLTLNHVTLADNSAHGNIISTDQTTYGGGGIWNYRGTVTIHDSLITGNQGRVGGVLSTGGMLNVQNTTFSSNSGSEDYGGDIGALNGGSATIAGSTFASNSMNINSRYNNTNPSTSVQVSDSSFAGRIRAYGYLSFDDSSVGTLILNGDGDVRNSTADIIATKNYIQSSDVTIDRSTVRLVNQDGDDLVISNSTFDANGISGRALYVTRGATLLENVTVSGYVSSEDGTVYFVDGNNATVRNATITDNTANRGGGIFVSSGTLQLDSTIVAGNTATLLSDDISGNLSGDRNLIFDPTGVFLVGSDNLFGLNPQLDILADNGGPTLTHALIYGSPAIDTGFNPAGLLTDQRGMNRLMGASTDIGAYEGFLMLGDANRDGLVNLADLQILGDNWQSTTATWSQADFTRDGNVNLADLQIIGDNWDFGVGPDISLDEALTVTGLSIPEPGSLAIMLLSLGAYCGRRRMQ